MCTVRLTLSFALAGFGAGAGTASLHVTAAVAAAAAALEADAARGKPRCRGGRATACEICMRGTSCLLNCTDTSPAVELLGTGRPSKSSGWVCSSASCKSRMTCSTRHRYASIRWWENIPLGGSRDTSMLATEACEEDRPTGVDPEAPPDVGGKAAAVVSAAAGVASDVEGLPAAGGGDRQGSQDRGPAAGLLLLLLLIIAETAGAYAPAVGWGVEALRKVEKRGAAGAAGVPSCATGTTPVPMMKRCAPNAW